jgi:hypothetical protein
MLPLCRERHDIHYDIEAAGRIESTYRVGRAEGRQDIPCFMIEALAAHTALAERRMEFLASAYAAEQEVAEYGLVYDADEVFSYLRDKVTKKRAKRPRPVKL